MTVYVLTYTDYAAPYPLRIAGVFASHAAAARFVCDAPVVRREPEARHAGPAGAHFLLQLGPEDDDVAGLFWFPGEALLEDGISDEQRLRVVSIEPHAVQGEPSAGMATAGGTS